MHKILETLQSLKNQRVERLFIILWPPYGEDHLSNIDISIGLVLSNDSNRMCVISTDKDDGCTPSVDYTSLPDNVYEGSLYDSNVKNWMTSSSCHELDTEYYEVTDAITFKNIVSHEIQSVKLILWNDTKEPFGVKIIFENDYIVSSPISDGNTIETAQFNLNDNLSHFESAGGYGYMDV